MMEKKRLTRILVSAPRDEVLALADLVEAAHEVRVVRPAAKTLVMLRVKEPVKRSAFYLGETVATHCSVQVRETMGISVVMGDDYGRARAMAVLDAAHSAALPQLAAALPRILAWEESLLSARRREAAQHRKTKVEFKIMEDSAS